MELHTTPMVTEAMPMGRICEDKTDYVTSLEYLKTNLSNLNLLKLIHQK